MGRSSHRCIPEIVESNSVTGVSISQEQAIGVAADAARVAGLPAAAHLVERLDGQHPYFLVHLGEPGGPGAAVLVDAINGSVMARASLERVEQPWMLKQERAVEIAGCAQSAHVRLVWKPSRPSQSAFYPLWEVTAASGIVWVDQSGRLWRELTLAGPG